jgi:hypothetical protein
LLARLQLDFVMGMTAQQEMMEALKDLPRDSIDAYERIMSLIKKSKMRFPFRALTWVLHAARPLGMEELREALLVKDWSVGLDKNHEKHLTAEDIIRGCQSFLVHEKSCGIVRFAHATVREFLEPRSLAPVIDLAKTCLTYLNFDVFEEGPCHYRRETKKRVQRHRFSSYAAQFWAFHVKGETEEDVDVQRAIFRLWMSKNKRNSMLEMKSYDPRYFYSRTNLDTSQTLLHFIAENGLAKICSRLIEGPSEHEWHLPVAIEINLAVFKIWQIW